MNSIVDALFEMKYNPFKYSHHIASFYSKIGGLENNLLLANLVIPLCSHPIFGKKLNNANKRSSIWSIFNEPRELYDLQERVDEFQNLTSQCIQYCLVNDWLLVDEEKLALCISPDPEVSFVVHKNAAKLGQIFKVQSVVEIYGHLGVKPR